MLRNPLQKLMDPNPPARPEQQNTGPGSPLFPGSAGPLPPETSKYGFYTVNNTKGCMLAQPSAGISPTLTGSCNCGDSVPDTPYPSGVQPLFGHAGFRIFD